MSLFLGPFLVCVVVTDSVSKHSSLLIVHYEVSTIVAQIRPELRLTLNATFLSTGCPRKIDTITVAFIYNRERIKVKKSLKENKLNYLPTKRL